jgi:hypothetical protein
MIRVNDDWVIMVDPLNYMPAKDMHRKKQVKQKDGTYTTEPDYKTGYGYYTSLKGAVRRIAQEEYKKALTGQETALNDAIILMDETVTRFERILEGIKE